MTQDGSIAYIAATQNILSDHVASRRVTALYD